jgi:RNA polymerase-binding transcription factor DksA
VTAAAVRAALATERAAVGEWLAAAQRDFARIVEAARSVSTDDEHDPDGPGLAVERALIDARRAHARARLAGLDRALVRLEEGRYGRCEECDQEIGAARLAARPSAVTCMGCEAKRRH